MQRPLIDFGRAITNDIAAGDRREWLVTNGIGGFAAGTISTILTRCYHGALVAALRPPLGRTLMLTSFDIYASYGERVSPLFSNRWEDQTIETTGHRYIERFYLDGTIPVWIFALGDARLEKRIWMQPGQNTTYMQLRLLSGSEPMGLSIKTIVNFRDYHGATSAGDFGVEITPVPGGLRCQALPNEPPLYLLSDHATAQPQHAWYYDYYLAVEAERGLVETEDHLYGGLFSALLEPGQSLLLVASTESEPSLAGAQLLAERQAYEAALLAPIDWSDDPRIRQLVLAADQFIVRRATPNDPDGRTILAGYHWFSDWGRDTMISLPGLTLPTGRFADAAKILRTFAQFVDQGMLPNRFPDEDEAPEYNTCDATLWYFEAIRAYLEATDDRALLGELFPILAEIIGWHQRGTRYDIGVDPADGLLRAGNETTQLTWMDVKVEGWVVTPRHGKAVEINALWYNALCCMAEFARLLGEDHSSYEAAAQRVKASFSRFWNPRRGCCYDVIDTPYGVDATIRPNQIFAVSLCHSPLDPAQQRAVVEVCHRKLLTSHGLRSLDPDDHDYAPIYLGTRLQRDAAYHQGTVWGWLIGPFLSAHLRVYHDPAAAHALLEPLLHHLSDAGLGTISEIFDAEPPHLPRGCIAQAWSVAEVLRICHRLAKG